MQYDETRPAFVFTTTKYATNINEHLLGSQLPKAGQERAVRVPPAATFGPLMRSTDSPRILADWIYSDRPQLHIHAVQFQDATLLTTTSLHTLMDSGGRSAFLQVWTAVLDGREDEVPPFDSYERDPLSSLGRDTPMNQYCHSTLLIRGISLIIFGIRYAFELLWFWNEEDHAIRLSGRAVDRMRDIARRELSTKESDGSELPFLSEGDILASWWMKTMVTALRPAFNRPIMLMTVFNVVSLFPEWFLGCGVYISNAIFPSYTILPVHQVLQEPIGVVAKETRRALVEHRTREQVQALAAIQRASFRMTVPLFGRSDLLFLACGNLHKARYFEVDFSTAVVAPGAPLSGRAYGLGRPSYINIIEHSVGYPTRNVLRVVGKDAAGDWWLTSRVRAEAWPAIDQQLAALEDNVGLQSESAFPIEKCAE